MTHLTFGAYRAGVRDKGVTLSSWKSQPFRPTPYPSASASIARFHREGPDAAWYALDNALASSNYWGPNGTPQATGWANAIRACFRVYRSMAEVDPRPSFATSLNRTLYLPPDDLGVHIDVVLLDPAGYVPRLVLWDKNDLTPDRAALYAAPVWSVLEGELGVGRIPRVEIWHLRSADQEVISAEEATASLERAEEIVRRVVA
jgi:hypothetical protein